MGNNVSQDLSKPASQQDRQTEVSPDVAVSFQRGRRSSTWGLVALAAFGTSALMTLFRLLKHLLLPNLTNWQSHVIAIIFSTAAAAVVCYLALSRQSRRQHEVEVYLRSAKETAERSDLNNKMSLERLARANADLQRFNDLYVQRELRMVDLKKHINELSGQLGQLAPYSLTFLEKDAPQDECARNQ